MPSQPGDTGSVSTWLRAETTEHLTMLTRLRKRVVRKLDQTEQLARREGGSDLDITPDRDLCRVIQRYQTGYALLLVEERERAKLSLMARLKGEGKILTDEEYESELLEVGREAMGLVPAEDLVKELARRGLKLPAAATAAETDDEDE